MGYQAYKLLAAAWIVFVIVYLPLVLLTGTFTIVPDTWPEIAVLVGLTLMGGIGPHGPNEERELMRQKERGDIAALARAHAARDFVNAAPTPAEQAARVAVVDEAMPELRRPPSPSA